MGLVLVSKLMAEMIDYHETTPLSLPLVDIYLAILRQMSGTLNRVKEVDEFFLKVLNRSSCDSSIGQIGCYREPF